MRTTMNTIYRMIQNNLNKITSDMNVINTKLASGRQMSKISDNPVNMVSALAMRSGLAEINQYQENLSFGNSMITASESALTQMKELIIDSKNQALIGINDSQNPTTRTYVADEIHVYLEQAVTLANTKWDGKYVFGGYRTTGYTDIEPTPFMLGYIDGYRATGQAFIPLESMLTGTVGTTDLGAGDLTLNGEDVGAVALNVALTNGLNMTGAANLQTAVNGIAWPPGTTPVTASLTTLTAGGAENATGNTTDVSVTVNGVNITYTTTGANPAADMANALNQYTDQTGVTAELADGTNGGAAPPPQSIVLKNVMEGDESDINITALTETANPAGPPAATSGLAVGAYTAAAANTGEISFSSTESFQLGSNNVTDDSVLSILGFDGGTTGFADEPGDGIVVYGYQLAPNDLEINGIPVGTINPDGISDVYADSSAAAKADAINAITNDWVDANGDTVPGTGVTAEVTPVFRQAPFAVNAGTIGPGDLIINGVDIFAGGPQAILDQDTDNELLNAINAQQASTGIVATRSSSGQLGLKAVDGRNLHIQTTANGNYISELNGSTPGPQDTTYFGRLQLLSDRTFMLESALATPYPPGGEEPGLAAIGLSGGSTYTGEPADITGDGKLSILSLAQLENNVRYTGDRDNDAEIKVGATASIAIAKNGEDAIMDTGVFTTLKQLEDYLRGRNYTFVAGIHAQDNIYLTLDSLNNDKSVLEDKFQNGDITITVTDHDFYPPTDFEMRIPVDITQDTPETIAQKINGIPGLSSSWDSTGSLHIDSTDPGRYTFDVTNDTSHTLDIFGINAEQLQNQGLTQAIADLDTLNESLSTQISDFGARANRITVQTQIYDNLELANEETLSGKQDTDIIEAIMDLKAKEVAYQAALSSAAKTMQLSLVDYL